MYHSIARHPRWSDGQIIREICHRFAMTQPKCQYRNRTRPVLIISMHKMSSLRISNPGNLACFHFKVPFESSNLPGSGPIFPH